MTPRSGADRDGKRPGEFEIIEDIFAPLATAPGALALKDDAAFLKAAPGCELVLTVDAMVAGVHFFPDDPADSIARKLLRVNLSDLAAKGAVPKGYLLVTAWTDETDYTWIRRFASGLESDQALFSMSLLGGDTVKTPGPLTLSLTAIGEVPEGTMLRRGGGQAGDDLYVTGTIGDAALGLKLLRGELPGLSGEHAAFLTQRYRVPDPRISVGPEIRGIAHAALDVSDGLMGDLAHMCAASGVGAQVELARLPLSAAAGAALSRDPGLIEAVASGGDDYEILFAAPPEKAGEVNAVAAETGVGVTRIGKLVDAQCGIVALDGEGREIPLPKAGYRHF